MPRIARIVVPGLPHHITQRGNNRQDVFFVDDDRRVYLELLKQQSRQFDLSVQAYCLMTNHVHLVATPRQAESLALAIGRTNWLYTQYINRVHGRSGHLWQNRFFSCAVAGDQLLHSVCYAERTPVRARMVRLPWRYRWSSAAAHIGEGDPFGVLDVPRWTQKFPPRKWRAILQRPQDELIERAVERSLNTGRPLASDHFLSKLEKAVGRRLRPLPVGRPKRKERRESTKRVRARK